MSSGNEITKPEQLMIEVTGIWTTSTIDLAADLKLHRTHMPETLAETQMFASSIAHTYSSIGECGHGTIINGWPLTHNMGWSQVPDHGKSVTDPIQLQGLVNTEQLALKTNSVLPHQLQLQCCIVSLMKWIHLTVIYPSGKAKSTGTIRSRWCLRPLPVFGAPGCRTLELTMH